MAFALRIFDIDAVPLEVHADELAGLVGVANIVHGRTPLVPFFDLRVQYLPLYGTIEYCSTLLFGNVPFAFRLPAVLLGVVSVAALRWLVYELAQSAATADTAAAIFAVLPWAVQISRIAWEPAAVFPFLLAGLAALAWGLRLRDGRSVFLSAGLLGIGAYSYRAEPFDGAILAATLVFVARARAATLRGPLFAAVAVALACVAPLALAVYQHPHFFWRDAGIATFGQGFTAAAFATFAHNYAAHFAVGSLFATGDGYLDHGPRYGVLYWWMLPFALLGVAFARGLVPGGYALFLYVWLALYPLGGALTNDGVPDFPRTLVGAPLACIFTALGLRYVWRRLRPRDEAGEWRRRSASAVLAVIVAVSAAAYAREYFLVYPSSSADAFSFGTASLFRTLRTFEGSYARVCFGSLDWYNYETFTGYYLAGSPLMAVETVTDDCRAPGSLIVVADPAQTVPHSHLLATQQNYEGAISWYVFGT